MKEKITHIIFKTVKMFHSKTLRFLYFYSIQSAMTYFHHCFKMSVRLKKFIIKRCKLFPSNHLQLWNWSKPCKSTISISWQIKSDLSFWLTKTKRKDNWFSPLYYLRNQFKCFTCASLHLHAFCSMGDWPKRLRKDSILSRTCSWVTWTVLI